MAGNWEHPLGTPLGLVTLPRCYTLTRMSQERESTSHPEALYMPEVPTGPFGIFGSWLRQGLCLESSLSCFVFPLPNSRFLWEHTLDVSLHTNSRFNVYFWKRPTLGSFLQTLSELLACYRE